MTYTTECSGTITVDRQLSSAGSLATIIMTDAVAQRFVPTSRCLANVVLRLSKVLNNDAYIEIKPDSGGLPSGNPQSGTIYKSATIPYTSISSFPTFREVTVPLSVVLPDLNPVWIVVCLYAYVSPCNVPSCTDTSFYVDGGGSGTGTSTEYGARKNDVNPWTEYGSIWFKTNKQSYSLCTQPSCNFTLP